MDSNSWGFSSGSSNATATAMPTTTASSHGGQTTNSSSSSSLGTDDIIGITVALWMFFMILCFLCRWFYLQQHHTRPPDANASSLKSTKRKEFVKSHLPFRTIQPLAMEEDEEGEQQADVADVDEEMGIVKTETGPIPSPSLSSHPPSRDNNDGDAKEDDDGDADETATSKSSSTLVLVSSSSTQERPMTKHSSRCCNICLNSYHANDDVAWSTNPACSHQYHRTCIEPWLLLHEECPLCRCIFLLPQQPVEEEEGEEPCVWNGKLPHQWMTPLHVIV